MVFGEVLDRRHSQRTPGLPDEPPQARRVVGIVGDHLRRQHPLGQVVDALPRAALGADDLADVQQPLDGDLDVRPVPPVGAATTTAELGHRHRPVGAQRREDAVAHLLAHLVPALTASAEVTSPEGEHRPLLDREHARCVRPVLERAAAPVRVLDPLARHRPEPRIGDELVRAREHRDRVELHGAEAAQHGGGTATPAVGAQQALRAQDEPARLVRRQVTPAGHPAPRRDPDGSPPAAGDSQTRWMSVAVPRPPPQHIVTRPDLLVLVLELVQQRGQQPRAGRTQRMADRHRAAARVHAVHVGPVLARPRCDDRREGLVDLDEVDVVDRHRVALEDLRGGRDRALEHLHRVAADRRLIDDPRPRAQAELIGLLARHQQHGGGAVGDLRRVAGRDPPVLLEHRFQRRRAPPATCRAGCPGRRRTVSPLTWKGTISRSNLPSSVALAASWCERSASSSSSERGISH